MSILSKLRRRTSDGVVITTERIEKPSPRYMCCNGQPATLDVYANGTYYVYACPLCVDEVPGYGGGLKIDDVIPDSWDVLDADGDILLRVHATSEQEAVHNYDTWIRTSLAPNRAVAYRPTTARTLFNL